MTSIPTNIQPENFCVFLEELSSGKKKHLLCEVLSYYEILIEQGKVYADYLYSAAILALFVGERQKGEKYTAQVLTKNATYEKYVALQRYVENGVIEKNDIHENRTIEGIIDPFIQAAEKKCAFSCSDFPYFVADVMFLGGKYLLDGADIETAFYFFITAYLCGAPRDSVYYRIGYMFYKNNDMKNAYSYLNASIKENATNVTALLDLSHVAIEMGNREASFAALSQAYELYPDYADIAYRMAQFYLEEHNYEKTKECLERALSVNPKYTVANITYFYVLFKTASQATIRAFIDSLENNELYMEFEFLYSLRYDTSLEETVRQLCAINSYEEKLLEGAWDRFLLEIPSERYSVIFENLLKTKAINEGSYRIIKGRFC